MSVEIYDSSSESSMESDEYEDEDDLMNEACGTAKSSPEKSVAASSTYNSSPEKSPTKGTPKRSSEQASKTTPLSSDESDDDDDLMSTTCKSLSTSPEKSGAGTSSSSTSTPEKPKAGGSVPPRGPEQTAKQITLLKKQKSLHQFYKKRSIKCINGKNKRKFLQQQNLERALKKRNEAFIAAEQLRIIQDDNQKKEEAEHEKQQEQEKTPSKSANDTGLFQHGLSKEQQDCVAELVAKVKQNLERQQQIAEALEKTPTKSQSPELVCLDDTENEESPQKFETPAKTEPDEFETSMAVSSLQLEIVDVKGSISESLHADKQQIDTKIVHELNIYEDKQSIDEKDTSKQLYDNMEICDDDEFLTLEDNDVVAELEFDYSTVKINNENIPKILSEQEVVVKSTKVENEIRAEDMIATNIPTINLEDDTINKSLPSLNLHTSLPLNTPQKMRELPHASTTPIRSIPQAPNTPMQAIPSVSNTPIRSIPQAPPTPVRSMPQATPPPPIQSVERVPGIPTQPLTPIPFTPAQTLPPHSATPRQQTAPASTIPTMYTLPTASTTPLRTMSSASNTPNREFPPASKSIEFKTPLVTQNAFELKRTSTAISSPISNVTTPAPLVNTSNMGLKRARSTTPESSLPQQNAKQIEPKIKTSETKTYVDLITSNADEKPAKRLLLDPTSNAAFYDKIKDLLPAYEEAINIQVEAATSTEEKANAKIKRLNSDLITLNSAIKTKSLEWGRLVHLKRVKEELLARVLRGREYIIQSRSGDVSGFSLKQLTELESYLSDDQPTTQKPMANHVMELITNCANMTSKDLSVTDLLHDPEIEKIRAKISNMDRNQKEAVKNNADQPKRHNFIPDRDLYVNRQEQADHWQQKEPVLNNRSNNIRLEREPQQYDYPQFRHTERAERRSLSIAPQFNEQHYGKNSNQYLAAAVAETPHIQSQAAPTPPVMGRQGYFKDVKSIIEEYRRDNPDVLQQLRMPQRAKAESYPSTSNYSNSRSYTDLPTLQKLLDGANRNFVPSRHSETMAPMQKPPQYRPKYNPHPDISIAPVYRDDSPDRTLYNSNKNLRRNMTDSEYYANNITSNGQPNKIRICQECYKNEANFVCAGCKNQWYCSKECQLAAWDKHHEVECGY